MTQVTEPPSVAPSAPAPAKAIRGTWRHRGRRRQAFWGYAFIAPNFLGIAAFLLLPIVISLGLSFTSWDMVSDPEFVGLDNYQRMAGDAQLWVSLRNTAALALMSIPLGIAASLGLALALNRKLRGINIFRAAFFLPVIASMVAVAMVWRWVYNSEFGLLNQFLESIGIPGQNWLTDPDLVLPSLVLVMVWKSMGYNMVLFLAGLRAIPRHLYEAAELDGANAWQQFRNVTLPLLTPTMFFVTVMSIIGSFQVFDVVYIMTGGGPGDASRVYYYWLWQNAFEFFRMGYASAMAWLLFVILFVATLIQMRFIGRRVQYEMG
ncbi:sugar ABC transporter permease [Actinotalea sp. BY-33]|uniref:Sugar ABC transporter permease n=1 Tax=Actinotalea soli TaxID=2819234 RepID=A0A939LSY2_9CELL|nr:sugar ABC transporter permease [Actinotalea soli]MBO1752130.1 sugar ABC transporter permease [Actinotalea soli]